MITRAIRSGGALQAPASLADRQADAPAIAELLDRTDRILASEGAGHLVHDLPVRSDGRGASVDSRPWRLDPVPLTIDPAVFGWLVSAVAERMDRLERVLGDLYGERRLVGERVVPAEVLASSSRYRLSAVGAAPRRWLSMYAVDLMVDAQGYWSVAQDLTDAPPGLGYSLLNRSVMSRVVPDEFVTHGIAPLAQMAAALRAALAAVSVAESPRIVVYSSGIDHPSYVDHSYLAVQLGLNLVEGADLVVRRRRLWLRSLDGLEPVDVLYRRVEDPGIDPLDTAATGGAGIPGLLQALRSGGVALANAHGSGVLEDPLLRPYLDDALARIAPSSTALGSHVAAGNADPTCIVSPGLLGPDPVAAAVVVRLFAVRDESGVTVMPGGTGRVLAPGDDPGMPTAGVAKDIWIRGPGLPNRMLHHLPQVDFGRSAPTRAADALHWMNRSVERAEAMVRTARVIASKIELDPGLVALDDGTWVRAMSAVTSAAGWPRMPELPAEAFDPPHGRTYLGRCLGALTEAASIEVGAMLTEATTVREFLSSTTGRVLAHLADLRPRLRSGTATVDDLDAILADFAALAGLWNESTVGGPAWVLGDIGRRLERAQVVLDLVNATFLAPASVVSGPRGDVPGSAAANASIEVLLAALESLVAYRRRHRSDVERAPALALVLTDPTNPRSLGACLERLLTHAEHSDWDVGVALFVEAREALLLPLPDMVSAVRPILAQAGNQLVERWFSTPVNPIVMGANR